MKPPRTPRTAGRRRVARPQAVPWLEHAWPWALAALFAFALAWRLAYQVRLGASPMAGELQGDERDYWEWASRLLGNGFHGNNPFFQGPLYPYVLAVMRAVVGSDPVAVFRVQAVAGAFAVVVLADAARRLARPWVALALGAIMALYEMSVLFDGLVLMESLLFLLEALLLWAWCRAAAKAPSWRSVIAMALLTGLVAQCRATGALLLLPTAWVVARAGNPAASLARARVGVTIALFVLTMLPATLWNWSRAHEFIPFTYNFGYNLYVGNNPQANGTFSFVTEADSPGPVSESGADGGMGGDGREYLLHRYGLRLSPARSSAWWAASATTFARAHPLDVIALAGRKLLLMWNHSESPQLESEPLFRRFAGPLGLPWLGTFAFVGTLGLAGFALAGRAGLAGSALRLYVLLVTAGVLPFFTTDRYRHHLVPGAVLLGAIAVEAALVGWRSGGARGARAVAVALALAAAFVALPVRARDDREDAWRASRDLGVRWVDHGQTDLAVQEFQHALALQHELGLDHDPDPATTSTRATLDFAYANALHRQGRDDEALRWFEEALREEPGNSIYLRTLADAYLVHGRTREGDSLLTRLGGLVGAEGEMWISRGWQAAREDRLDSAEVCFRRAVKADERLFGGWTALIRVQVERGECAPARASLTNAQRLRLPRLTLLAHEALVDAACGEPDAARRAIDAIPPEALAGDRTLQGVVRLARERMPTGR